MLPLLFALWARAALALTQPTPGVWVDLGAGSAFGGVPIATPGGLASAGVFLGRYDADYAIGRFWSFGATWRGGYAGGFRQDLFTEVRRGVDILVAAPYFGVAGGVGLGAETTGLAEAVLGVKWRLARTVGLSLRTSGGARFGATIQPSLGAHLVFSWSRPFAKPPSQPPPLVE